MRTHATPPVQADVTVNATPERSFEIFTDGMRHWWPASYHIGDGELADVRIEPKTGGRWYEVTTDGTECDWGYVISWDPPDGLALAWQLTPEFGYDPSLVTTVEIRFTEVEPGRTRVTLEHGDLDQYGLRSIEMRDVFSQDGGWPTLLAAFADLAS